jgi:hypothetical protein
VFEVYDRQTKQTVGTAKTREGARRSVDRRDNAYGAVRYAYRAAGSDRMEF